MAKQGQATNQGLDGLTAAARDAANAGPAGKGLPPVHLWNPPFCGDLDMRIASDGTWFYMGTPIGRPALVRLFSTVLKREGGKYFLVTPVEKVGIRVDDAPFLAVEMLKDEDGRGRLLRFRTNVDDWVPCGPGHALALRGRMPSGGLKPYLHVRARSVGEGDAGAVLRSGRRSARSARSTVKPMFGVASGGEFFAMADAEQREGVRFDTSRADRRITAAIDSAEFFDRAPRAAGASTFRPGLTIPNITPARGDHDADRDAGDHRRAYGRSGRPRCWSRWSTIREPTVLLTQRAAHLNDHAGQIAFPGGKIDATDASPLDAALREAEEEIGLDREFVEPLGYLDLYVTGFGYRIVPTVARVKPGFKLTLNEREVDDAFEVPLAFLMDPANHQLHSGMAGHGARHYYAMPFGERYIWGVTAGILRVCTSGSTAMIRPVPTEIGFPDAVRALRGCFWGDQGRRAGAVSGRCRASPGWRSPRCCWCSAASSFSRIFPARRRARPTSRRISRTASSCPELKNERGARARQCRRFEVPALGAATSPQELQIDKRHCNQSIC